MAAKKVLEKLQLEIKDTLETLGYIEVVSVSSKKDDMRFLCRVTNEPKWLALLHSYLSVEPDYYVFIGKKYFVSKGKLLYGWVIILESDKLDATTRSFRQSLLTAHEDLFSEDQADPAEPESYTVPLPFSTGYGKKLQNRVKPIG